MKIKFYPNASKTENNINNEGTYSSYQDKYFLKKKKIKKEKMIFETLAGNSIKVDDINHNNMNIYIIVIKQTVIQTI